MCRELAAEKLASETILTKLKAEYQALDRDLHLLENIVVFCLLLNNPPRIFVFLKNKLRVFSKQSGKTNRLFK
jgi:hypothetical protein